MRAVSDRLFWRCFFATLAGLLSDLALECELDRTYVSAVERSRWNVSLSNIERLAVALEVPAWTLLVPVEQGSD